MNIELNCPHCNQRISVDPAAAGKQIKCPTCLKTVTIPAPAESAIPQESSSNTIFCPKCGQMNNENNFKCTKCSFILHSLPQQQYVVTGNGTMGGLIPYRNAKALMAYYFGIFSLIPIIGIPLGIVAIVLGIKGLKYADLHPEARGKAHAWAGIILGSLCFIGYIVLMLVAVL